ncbi:hypothetical protein Val02_56420 [Virgisporangium aliadipatigenens]|uniref:Uncharacterized protein n=1 Tax=Virgisporangium aliadipatigenens TaxID=741659 RepID=A0A8J3YS00_9ACTN|nr:hypothetical protein [Virgisporangium aliadipatigenens]GIJ48756.1 hypothetical protein Val02_56420 [Virgisporangium aliadipatigenens]
MAQFLDVMLLDDPTSPGNPRHAAQQLAPLLQKIITGSSLRPDEVVAVRNNSTRLLHSLIDDIRDVADRPRAYLMVAHAAARTFRTGH